VGRHRIYRKKPIVSTTISSNYALSGDWTPVTREAVLENLVVEGEIPSDLVGTLYRNCSNQRFSPLSPEHFHPFDGDGMMYSIELRDEKASYRSKWVATDGAKVEFAAGRTLYNGLFGASGIPQPELPPDAPLVKHVGSVNVIRIDGRTLALQESTDRWWEIDARTLEVRAPFNFFGNTVCRGALTAHPHVDHATGNLIFVQLDSRVDNLDIAEADPTGNVIHKYSVRLGWTAYIHDLIFTADYYIVMLGPIGWDTDFGPVVRDGRSSWHFDPDRGSQIVLVNRSTGAVQTITVDPNQVNHYLNAYQEGELVIIDASVAPIEGGSSDTIVSDAFPFSRSGNWETVKPAALWRWTINPAKGVATHEHTGGLAVDFPRPNETLMGSKHRYGYFMSNNRETSAGGNAAVKHDYQTGATVHQLGSKKGGLSLGEPIFVPRAGATGEDDGYVLVICRDGKTQTSELLILDAQNFDAEPLARVKINAWLPTSVHGNWMPDTLEP
jgi:carotenoid cleavage dioxygenase